MDKYVILADSNCDLNEQFRKEYDIGILTGHVVYPDGKEHPSSLDWNDLDCEKFYADLKKNPNGYKTSPPNETECYEVFESYVKQGKGVLAISISASLSGTYDFMTMAKKRIEENYPDAEISIVDSRRFGPGFGLMAVYAATLRNEGKTMEETVSWLETNKNRFHQAGWLDDLSFVAKKGRLTHAKAFFGTLIGIKPIGEFDYNGLTTVIGKAKGEKQGYRVLPEYVAATIENPEDQIIFIANSCRRKQAEKYKEILNERFHPKAIYVNDVYAMCGINVGPGLMAAYYLGKPISEGLVEERALVEKLLSETK